MKNQRSRRVAEPKIWTIVQIFGRSTQRYGEVPLAVILLSLCNWTLLGKRRGHGRLGRVETGQPTRTRPIGTEENTFAHRRDACSPLQKSAARPL